MAATHIGQITIDINFGVKISFLPRVSVVAANLHSDSDLKQHKTGHYGGQEF